MTAQSLLEELMHSWEKKARIATEAREYNKVWAAHRVANVFCMATMTQISKNTFATLRRQISK